MALNHLDIFHSKILSLLEKEKERLSNEIMTGALSPQEYAYGTGYYTAMKDFIGVLDDAKKKAFNLEEEDE